MAFPRHTSAICQSSPAVFAQWSASSASASAASGRSASISATQRIRRTRERVTGSPSARAIASAPARTAGCSAPRPSRHTAVRLDAQQADAKRRTGVRLRQAQGPVDPVHRRRRSGRVPPSSRRAPHTSRPPARRSAGRPPIRGPHGGCRSRRPAGRGAPGVGAPKRAIGSVALGELEVVAIVVLADGVDVSGAGEALAGVGADRLEHPQPGGGVRVLAVGREGSWPSRPSRVSRPACVIVSAALTVAPPGERREACEALLLSFAEQVVAPVDGRAQRLLACGRVAGAGAERIERVVQAFGDLARRQQSAARRRQLDGQRQAVEAPAYLRDRPALASSRSKPGSWARARAQNSATAGTPASASASSVVARAGSANGETG